MTDYDLLARQADALISGHFTADLANISALIYSSLENLNWAGFYLFEGETLVLGPFQGNVACVEIQKGKGVCGTAATQDKTVVVPDVHKFCGHIACDSASRSEIVVPIHSFGKVTGVLDIDSPVFSRFSEEDRKGLEKLALLIEKKLF
ncbi:MAG: GAF domain-containing protein [Clostridia bacterium]|nr:GAF domain-containing protein [Clostridia bacterium]